jgi:hypothetical protein
MLDLVEFAEADASRSRAICLRTLERFGMEGRDNGAPGLQPHHHEHDDAALVLDPDGHTINAVCHSPE